MYWLKSLNSSFDGVKVITLEAKLWDGVSVVILSMLRKPKQTELFMKAKTDCFGKRCFSLISREFWKMSFDQNRNNLIENSNNTMVIKASYMIGVDV